MASPRFLEILRCNGVDQGATPHPGMIVPFLGENQVILETPASTWTSELGAEAQEIRRPQN